MWSLIITLMINTTNPPEMRYIELEKFKTYQECKKSATDWRKNGLDTVMFCVERQN